MCFIEHTAQQSTALQVLMERRCFDIECPVVVSQHTLFSCIV